MKGAPLLRRGDAPSAAQLVRVPGVAAGLLGCEALVEVGGLVCHAVDLECLAEDHRLGASCEFGHLPQWAADNVAEGLGVDLATDAACLDQRVVDVPQDEDGRHAGLLRSVFFSSLYATFCYPVMRCARDSAGGLVTPQPEVRIGERLRFYRQAKGKTQAVVAGLAGVTEDYLSQIERGLKTPTLPLVHRFSKILGVRVSELLGESATDMMSGFIRSGTRSSVRSCPTAGRLMSRTW